VSYVVEQNQVRRLKKCLESTFESVDVVSCPDGHRDGVPDDWSGNRNALNELSFCSWHSVLAAVTGA